MRRKSITLSVFFLLIGASFLASNSIVNAFSDTMLLAEGTYVSRIVEVEAGDRLVGDFTFSNIPTWKDSYTGDSITLQYSFKIAKAAYPDKVVFEVSQKEHSSFDITCAYSGNYIFKFYAGFGQTPTKPGIEGNPTATLNYQVVKPTQIPTPNNQSLFRNREISPLILAGLVIVIIILVGIGIYSVTNAKKKKL